MVGLYAFSELISSFFSFKFNELTEFSTNNKSYVNFFYIFSLFLEKEELGLKAPKKYIWLYRIKVLN